jgi:acetyltransferase EpsM
MKNLSRIVIFGAGALGHEIAEYACDTYGWSKESTDRILFIDDTLGLTSFNKSWEVVHTFSNYEYVEGGKFLIGLGNPFDRRKIYDVVRSRNYELDVLIHPSSYVSKYAKLSPGVVVAPHCTISAMASISDNVMLNTYSAVGHHVKIGHSSVLSPKVLLAGASSLGENVFVGSCAFVTPEIVIGNRCRIMAGAGVYRDCKDDTLISGNPAKSHEMK